VRARAHVVECLSDHLRASRSRSAPKSAEPPPALTSIAVEKAGI
jgi:hypothetical protein